MTNLVRHGVRERPLLADTLSPATAARPCDESPTVARRPSSNLKYVDSRLSPLGGAVPGQSAIPLRVAGVAVGLQVHDHLRHFFSAGVELGDLFA